MKKRAKRTKALNRPTKWDKVFRLLAGCLSNVIGGHLDIAKQHATEARNLALQGIHGLPRAETSMGFAVRDLIDQQITPFIDAGTHHTEHLNGAISCLKRMVAKEAAQRAVSRYQARLRRDKPHRRTWHEVDAIARQAIRDVRAELGEAVFDVPKKS